MILSSVSSSSFASLPVKSASRKADEPVDLCQLSPGEVLELSATRKLPRQAVLDALASVSLEVVNAVPSPVLRATLLAARAAHQDPRADKVVRKALDYSLNRWRLNHRYSMHDGGLRDIYKGADFQVVDNEVYLPVPSTGKSAGLKEALDSAKVGKVSTAIHQASRQEIDAELERLAHQSSVPHSPNSGYSQVAVMTRLLRAHPELATPELFQREIAPLVNGQEGRGPATELAITHFGAGPTLDLLLDAEKPDAGQFERIAAQLRNTAWFPSQQQLERLSALAVREASRFEGHNSLFKDVCNVLATANQRRRGSVSLETRQKLQDALLAHPQPLWPAYAAHYYPPVRDLAVGHPQLKDGMLSQLSHPAAAAYLTHASLNEGEWALLRHKVRQGPAFNNDHTPAEFARADFRRGLSGLAPAEAVAALPSLAASTGVALEDARDILMTKLLSHRAPADVLGLPNMSLSNRSCYYPVFEEGARQGRLDWTIDQVVGSLKRLSKGLVGGHEPAVAGLALLSRPERPIQEMEKRYFTVLESLHDQHGTAGASSTAIQILKLLDEKPTSELAGSLKGVARLKELGWKSSEPLRQMFQAIEGAPEDRGLELLDPILRSFEPAEFDQALALYQTIRNGQMDPGAALERFQQIRPCAPTGPNAAALLPAVDRLATRGRLEDSLIVLGRVLAGAPDSESYMPAAELALKALEGGASVEETMRATLGHLCIGATGEVSAGVGQVGRQLRVGGTALRMRTRS